MTTTYRAHVEHGERFWLVHVPEVDRWTQARHLREVDAMARDLIAVMTDADPDSFELDVDVVVPEDIRQELERSRLLRQEAARQQSEAAQLMRHAARRLSEQGFPLRDVGMVLDVSFQRAKQLVDEGKEGKTVA